MATELTPRQREVLEFVKAFARENGFPPTVREIGAHFGFVPRSVFDHLKALERKGYLRRRSSKSRSLEIMDKSWKPGPEAPYREIPVLGRVAAGFPILAVENLDGTMVIGKDWLDDAPAFLLRVRGDSMIEAHIQDGDHVLVRQQDTADTGDIVVALWGEEATVKRLAKRKDAIVLEPANTQMQPITVPKDDPSLRILGKVIGVLRRL